LEPGFFLNIPPSVVPLSLLVSRYTKQAQINAVKRLQFAQNDIEIRWIASSGILTIHSWFCYFKTVTMFIWPIGPVER